MWISAPTENTTFVIQEAVKICQGLFQWLKLKYFPPAQIVVSIQAKGAVFRQPLFMELII